jgi:hypothetical protein
MANILSQREIDALLDVIEEQPTVLEELVTTNNNEILSIDEIVHKINNRDISGKLGSAYIKFSLQDIQDIRNKLISSSVIISNNNHQISSLIHKEEIEESLRNHISELEQDKKNLTIEIEKLKEDITELNKKNLTIKFD